MKNKNSEAGARKRAASARQPIALSTSLDRRLSGYALAAGAAGVALLACSAPVAEAAPVCKTLSAQLFRAAAYPINPAGQAIAPFNLGQSTVLYTAYGYSTFSANWNRAFIAPNSLGAKVLLDSSGFPADVASGAAIGPGGNFGKGASYGLMFTYGKGPGPKSGAGTLSRHKGNFNFQQANLFGFEFAQSGQIHFGWVRMKAKVQLYQGYKRTQISVIESGYESAANTAIAAGSCTSGQGAKADSGQGLTEAAPRPSVPSAGLGRLAMGSAGLSLGRSEE
jgi:hypothetical protein